MDLSENQRRHGDIIPGPKTNKSSPFAFHDELKA